MPSIPLDASLLGLIGLTAILVQLVKPFIELVVKANNPVHDALVQIVATLLGLGLATLQLGLPSTGPDIDRLVSAAVAIGLGAVGGYHVATRQSSSNEPTTVDPRPGLQTQAEQAGQPAPIHPMDTMPPQVVRPA